MVQVEWSDAGLALRAGAKMVYLADQRKIVVSVREPSVGGRKFDGR
jgi:hypothetical protein